MDLLSNTLTVDLVMAIQCHSVKLIIFQLPILYHTYSYPWKRWKEASTCTNIMQCIFAKAVVRWDFLNYLTMTRLKLYNIHELQSSTCTILTVYYMLSIIAYRDHLNNNKNRCESYPKLQHSLRNFRVIKWLVA